MRNSTKTNLSTDVSHYQNFFGTLYINNDEVPVSDVLSMTIREWIISDSIIPRLELVMIDGGRLSDVDVPIEYTLIELNISKDSSAEEALNIKFDAIDFEIQNGAELNSQRVVQISALLHMDNLFNIDTKVYSGSSTKVINAVAGDLGLNYNKVNNISAQDDMTYYKLNQNNLSFINHVLQRSYIGEGDMLTAYADIEGNLNTLSIKNAINNNVKWNLKFDQSLATVTNDEEYKQLLKDKNINDQDDVIYYSNFSLVNFQGSLDNMGGYSVKSSYYDLQKDSFITKDISAVDNLVKTDFNPRDDFSSNTLYHYSGISNNYNTYDDYNHCKSNRVNVMRGLFGQTMEVEIDSFKEPKIGDIVNIIIPSKDDSETDIHNEPLSGKYIIISRVRHSAKMSIFKKRIIISRVGINNEEF